ncbi:MAG: DUF4252 domain-containing protein [Bacteroidota bacterium]
MRNIVYIVAIMSMPLLGLAQNSVEIFNKYKGKEDITTVSVSKYMFSLFSDVETDDPDSQEFLDLVQTLEGMKILTTEDAVMAQDIIKSVKKHMDKNDFKELMTVEENGKDVVFKIREEGKKVSELIMLVNEGDEVVFMSIVGNIDLKKISKLSKKMNISGVENLESIDDEK